MPTVSESQVEDLKERYERVIREFVQGNDSEAVLKARLAGLGYFGINLTAEMNLARMQKRDKTKNWNCDNNKCREPRGEVRVYPTGGGGNMILCSACFYHENNYRASRGGERYGFPQVEWATAETYKNGE